MQAVDFSDNLKLFQSSHSFNSSPILDKGTSIINSFIELDYLTMSSSGLKFTNAGIEYMMKKYAEFLANGGDTWDYGPMTSYKIQTKNAGHNINMQFTSSNLDVKMNDDDIDYNNISFKDKAPGDMEI